MNPEDLTRARNRLAAGRIRAMEKAPYLSTALLSLEPREIIGFGTFAVDQKWILYYDPQKCLDWTVDEIAAVWLHEISHVIRDHAGRFNATGDSASKAEYFNISADAAINSDLRDMGVSLPDAENRWYAEPNAKYPKWRRNMTAEEMYSIAKSGSGKPPEDTDGTGKAEDNENSDSGEDKDDSSSNSQENSSEETDDTEETSENSAKDEKNSEDEPDDSTDEDSGDSGSSEDSEGSESDEEETDNSSASNQDKDDEENSDDDSKDGSSSSSEEEEESDSSDGSDENNSEPESSSDSSDESSDEDGEGDTDGSSEGSEGSSEDESQESGSDGHSHEGNCGSGAHGIPQEYEVDDGSGFDPMEAEQMRRQVAQEINQYNDLYGTVPGGMVRDAKEILDPKVDWTEELLSQVRKEIATVVGQSDYTYSRPSRRATQTPFIMPSMRQAPPPEIVVILDTSGSMKIQEELAQALGEMEELIESAARHSTLGGIRIINCDAGANIPVIVSDLDDFEIVGGGGTDMRVGIKAASELDPPAGIIITMTDGFTPWPREVPEENQDALYIALIIDSSHKKSGHSQQRGWSTTGIPDWIQVIEVQT